MQTTWVISDNTVLTNLALVDQAQLLLNLWPNTSATTKAILTEYNQGVTNGLLPAGVWDNLTILSLTKKENDFACLLPKPLGL